MRQEKQVRSLEYYERVSADTDCSLHRNTSELSVILAPDPTPSRPIEMCEECVSQKERKKERKKEKSALPVGLEPTTSC